MKILLVLLNLLFLFPLHADDHDEDVEIPYPTEKEALAFLKEHLPLAITLIESVRETEDEEAYEEVLEHAIEHVFEYREFLHYDGEALAQLHIKGLEIEMSLAHMIHRYHFEAETAEEKKAFRDSMKPLVQRQLEHAKAVAALELQKARETVAEIEEEIQELNALGEEEIEEEIQDLLEDEDEEEDDEDEDEDDE